MERETIRNLGIYGVIRQAEVDDVLIPDGAVTEVQNFHFDRKGVSTVRPGLTTLGATITSSDVYPCVGLFNSQSSTVLAAFSGGGSSRIFWFDNGNWLTGLTGGTGSVSIRFVDFGSYTLIINMIANTLSSMYVFPTRVENTSYFSAQHSYIKPENMWGYNPKYGETYKSRCYLSGDPAYPSRLFFSSIISSAGKITWTPTVDFVDINPGDGEDNTGLKRFSLELLFFKPNYIYRFRTSSIDPDPLIKIGTRSQESIVEGKKGLYFHHDSGFYRYSGGYPVEISRPISDFVTSIPFSQYDDVAGWKDGDHIYWSVGNLTMNETTGSIPWKNVVLRYTESSELWTVYSYARDIRRGSPYVTGTSSSLVVGTDNGVVGTLNFGTTDFKEPIKYRERTKWYEWGGIENRKMISRLIILCEKSQGMQVMYQINEEYTWKDMGQLKKLINYIDPVSLKFNRIRFQATGVSSGEAPVFLGIIIPEMQNEGIIR